MKLFETLKNWFFSEEREQIKQLIKKVESFENVVETNQQVVINELRKLSTVYSKKVHTGDTTIVVMDGKVLEKEDSDKSIYNSLDENTSEKDIEKIFSEEEIEEIEVIPNDAFSILRKNKDFKILGKKVYYKDVELEIPNLILAEFIQILERLEGAKIKDNKADSKLYEDLYSRMSFFWLKTAYSPLETRDSIFKFCKNNDIKLSRRGNIIGYRRVVKWENSEKKATKELDSQLNDFIIEQWNKVKKAKKSPKNYNIYDDNSYVCIDNKKKHDYNNFIGVLSELKEGLTENVEVKQKDLYTSKHNSGKYVFSIGDVYKMEGEEPDMNKNNCASGGLKCVASL